MKTRLIGILLVLALAAALPLTASAQLNQTGSLVGTVSDNQKQPLPGVTVTIKSPSIILPQMDTISGAFKAAVSKVYKYPLFLTSEEIEKFAATPVLKPDGGVVRWNPPQSAIMP